jgi:osmoprotectant transport system substrate-binding protein
MFKKLTIGSLALTCAGALLAGCSLGDNPPSDVKAGSLAEAGNLKGVSVTVGSKEFTEQLVLCELTAQALESVGADVKRTCGLSGTSSVRAALKSGDIDMYWEYTGTGWVTHLGETKVINDADELFQSVATADKQKNKISWVDRAPANNTYAVAVAKEKADELGVKTLSDYAALAQKDSKAASFCGAAEFFGRDDGWPGLQDAYGYKVDKSHVSELAAGAVYNSIDKSRPCNFGEVFATDGRIAALGLTVLDDDKNFFTAYNPALSIRDEVLENNPDIAKVLAPISEALTDEALQSLNASVDVDGDTPDQAAKEWLVKGGFVK